MTPTGPGREIPWYPLTDMIKIPVCDLTHILSKMDRLWVIFRKFLADCKGMLLNQAHRHATVLLHAEAQHPQE